MGRFDGGQGRRAVQLKQPSGTTIDAVHWFLTVNTVATPFSVFVAANKSFRVISGDFRQFLALRFFFQNLLHAQAKANRAARNVPGVHAMWEPQYCAWNPKESVKILRDS